MWDSISGIIKVLLFFLGLFKERDAAKAKEKAEIAKEMIDALAETDKKLQASRINSAIARANRM